MNIYFRLIKYIKPYKFRFIQAVLCTLALGGVTGFLGAQTKVVLEHTFYEDCTIGKLSLVVGVLILAFFVKGILLYIQTYLMGYVGQRAMMDLRSQTYNHLQQLSITYYSKARSGQIMSRLTNDLSQITIGLTDTLARIMREPVMALGCLVVLFYLNITLTLITVFVLPLALLPIIAISNKLRKAQKKAQDKLANLNNVIHETIGGIKIIKAYNAEDKENEKFQKENQDYFNEFMRAKRKSAMSPPLVEFIGSFGFGIALIIGGNEVIAGRLDAVKLTSFLVVAGLMFSSIQKLTRENNRVQQAIASGERVFEILETPVVVMDSPGALSMEGIERSIRFENISFDYGHDPVLKNINLEINKGELVALVGSSGGGKTTLVNLLMRFHDPKEGRVLIDGVDIRDIRLKDLHDKIGIVTQDGFLFHDTIARNIAYRDDQPDMALVERSAKMAYAHDFILEQPQGYDTQIGERGIMLSGGQQQRLAIARALYNDPPILILDEATSNLDIESEKLVQSAIDNLMQGRTVIVIAHRLSTITSADKIVEIVDGEIANIGAHDELLKGEGIYKKLYELQFG